MYAPGSPGRSRANEQNRQLATQTLADFERDGLGHHLDNADADTLRAMVRICAERRLRTVRAVDTLAEVLDRGIPDHRKLATLSRLVQALRTDLRDGRPADADTVVS